MISFRAPAMSSYGLALVIIQQRMAIEPKPLTPEFIQHLQAVAETALLDSTATPPWPFWVYRDRETLRELIDVLRAAQVDKWLRVTDLVGVARSSVFTARAELPNWRKMVALSVTYGAGL